MKSLGFVINQSHSGMFVVLCDATAQFGGWDEYGEMLADEGSAEFDLNGLRAFVEEGHGGQVDIYRGADGAFALNNVEDGGVPQPALSKPPYKTVRMGTIDVPSGLLTIAIAYPALNVETDGDHAGMGYREHERMDVEVTAQAFAVSRAFVEGGNFVTLSPLTSGVSVD